MTDDPLSALVVMRSADGARVKGETMTAETIGSYLPDLAAVRAVADYLARAGFETSDPVGISFSIVAPRSRFESFFGSPLRISDSGGIATIETDMGLELPLDALPADISQYVDAITFTPPPDFGPTDYSDD